jgi:crotonobetainyl-CoA:carnitine CoA-transferase CaiB-like acyl-CoA transferase
MSVDDFRDVAGTLKPGRGQGPLSGIKVLDLSRVLAGPWCTQCLADLGADVLKIEAPGEGDDTRGWAPPYIGELSAYFTCANRSKQSLLVDLKSQAGRERIQALAAVADIVVENFKLGTLDRFKLGYADLKAINPRLIYCSISGYGRTGPEAARAGYDFLIQAETGLMAATGFADGPPTKVGVAVSDLFTGLYASQAILAALFERRSTGEGQFLDVALFDCQLAALANVAASALATGVPPRRLGNAHPTIVPYELFAASDAPFVLAIGNDRQFQILCETVVQMPSLAADPLYRRNSDRVANRVMLRTILQGVFETQPQSHWLGLLHANVLPAAAVASTDDALASDQARSRGLIREFPDAPGGPVRVVGYPVRFERGLPDPTCPPRLGEGGDEAAARWLAGQAK